MKANKLWRRTLAMTSIGAIAIAIVPASAAAQGTPVVSVDDAPLGEIIVTAQRRSQNVQEVPIAITVATADDIARLQITSIQSLQYSTPSLVVAGADPTRLRFGIRGISDQSRNPGFDNRIGVYVDDVWVGRSAAANQAVLDLASVEVLRGPQGTLFGKNTVAGAINMRTVRPQEGFSGYVEGEIGNYDLRQVRASLNLGFTENFAGRFSGFVTKRDGFIENISNGLDYNNRDDHGIRAQFQIKTGDTTIYLAGDSAKFRSRAVAGGERVPDPLAPRPRSIAHNDLQNYFIDYSGVSAQIDHDFDDGGKLTSITAHRTSDFRGSVDEDFSPANFAATELASENTEHFSQEIRYASDSSGGFDYVVGLFYLDQKIEGAGRAVAFAPALNPRAPAVFLRVSQNSVVDAKTMAAFVHTNYRPTDRLEITIGARLTREEKEISFAITDQTGLFANGTRNDRRASNDFSPTVSVNYKLDGDSLAYVRYARAFKSFGWNADFVPSLADFAFDDESVDAFEAGFKTEMFDRRLRLNVAAYLSKHSDYQVFTFRQLANGGTALNVSNAGKLTSKGIEIEAEAALTDWLRLFANYGYNEATFDSFRNGGGPGVDFDGNTAAEAPRHNLNLGVATDFDLGFAKLMIQGDYNYRSSLFSNPDNLPVNISQPLEQVNLRAGLDFGNVTVFGWMRNAFDVTETIYNNRSFLGLPRAVFNDPQTYGMTVKVSFGQ